MANRRAADLYAQSIAPIIVELRASGIVLPRAITDELIKRQVPTARGGAWHPQKPYDAPGVPRLLESCLAAVSRLERTLKPPGPANYCRGTLHVWMCASLGNPPSQ
jgi:hypothetical protein